MTKAQVEARIKFAAILEVEVADKNDRKVTRGAWYWADLLCRHGKTYARIQEMVCNGVEWSQYDTNESFNKRQARHEAYTERREKQLEKRIAAICAELGNGFAPVFSGDPRGCTVKIQVPSGKTTDFGGEGVCVPTA